MSSRTYVQQAGLEAHLCNRSTGRQIWIPGTRQQANLIIWRVLGQWEILFQKRSWERPKLTSGPHMHVHTHPHRLYEWCQANFAYLMLLFFEIGSHYVTGRPGTCYVEHVGLNHAGRSSCPYVPNAGIKGVYQYAWQLPLLWYSMTTSSTWTSYETDSSRMLIRFNLLSSIFFLGKEIFSFIPYCHFILNITMDLVHFSM